MIRRHPSRVLAGPPRRYKLPPEVVDAQLAAAGYLLESAHEFLTDPYLRVCRVKPGDGS